MRLYSITYRHYDFDTYFRDRSEILRLGGQMNLDPYDDENITRYLIHWP